MVSPGSVLARTHQNWLTVFLLTGVLKGWVRQWRRNNVPLPNPHMKNVVALMVRIRSLEGLRPGSRLYTDMLAWVSFLAKESPTILRHALSIMPKHAQWFADVVETVAATGRVALLTQCLRAFQRWASREFQKEKIWQWVDDPAFATPRIARALLRMSCDVLIWAKEHGENRDLSRKLLQGKAIVATIDTIAHWLTTKMPDGNVLGIARKTRSCPAAAAAFRATPRYQAIQHVRKFRATVYLTCFFRRHVSLAKARAATRGDCPICWSPKILHALHGDIRHGMCHACMRRMQPTNLLDRCPMCRVSLREESYGGH